MQTTLLKYNNIWKLPQCRELSITFPQSIESSVNGFAHMLVYLPTSSLLSIHTLVKNCSDSVTSVIKTLFTAMMMVVKDTVNCRNVEQTQQLAHSWEAILRVDWGSQWMENYLEDISKVVGICSLDKYPLKCMPWSLCLQGGVIGKWWDLLRSGSYWEVFRSLES